MRTRSLRARKSLASAVLAVLALLASAPLWHGVHPEPVLLEPYVLSGQDGQAHLRSGHVSASHPTDSCLVCQSKRLLNHGWAYAEANLAAPAITNHPPASSWVLPKIGASLSPGARAPPLA